MFGGTSIPPHNWQRSSGMSFVISAVNDSGEQTEQRTRITEAIGVLLERPFDNT